MKENKMILKFDLCDGTFAYFRCDLSQASAPIQHWDQGSWDSTQYQCADARHTVKGMAEICQRLLADWLEGEYTDYEQIANFGYRVGDSGSSETVETFDEAITLISEWYEDCDQWATGEGDEESHSAIRDAIDAICQPEGGGIDELRQYAESIRMAVAEAMGNEAFHGHGSYSVSAADQAGYTLEVSEVSDPE